MTDAAPIIVARIDLAGDPRRRRRHRRTAFAEAIPTLGIIFGTAVYGCARFHNAHA